MERLQFLFQKYLNNQISEEDFTEMWMLLKDEAPEGNLTPALQRLWKEKPEYDLPDSYWNRRLHTLKELEQAIPAKRKYFQKYAAAAAILLFVLGVGYLLVKMNVPINEKRVAAGIVLPHDVKAGRNGAILSFDNGKTIILDTARDGRLTPEVTKSNGGILVRGTGVEYATLTTPRARLQQLTLADGSKVWLNAASSIRFPSAFLGKERVVEITGEAYFEVAQDAASPFIVKVNEAMIKVLGTHFNVMAYSNEPGVQTTLLEGSVKFIKGQEELLLKPGQQSWLSHNGEIRLIEQADMEAAIAWKNGLQYFHNADLETIMRQVERWYDVDVTYKGDIPPRTFTGDIPRDVNLSALLKLFEVNKIHFSIDGAGKKLTVMP